MRMVVLRSGATKDLAVLRLTPQVSLRSCGEFAFPHALLEQNLRIIAHANLRSRMQWPASFNCQRTMFRIASKLSAPGGAARAVKTEWREIKNPASSAGRFLPHTLSEGFARSSTVVYPVFVTNLTSISKGRLPVHRGHRAPRSVFRHQRSIPIFWYSSSGIHTIFAASL
jgi:hypothetical protein